MNMITIQRYYCVAVITNWMQLLSQALFAFKTNCSWQFVDVNCDNKFKFKNIYKMMWFPLPNTLMINLINFSAWITAKWKIVRVDAIAKLRKRSFTLFQKITPEKCACSTGDDKDERYVHLHACMIIRMLQGPPRFVEAAYGVYICMPNACIYTLHTRWNENSDNECEEGKNLAGRGTIIRLRRIVKTYLRSVTCIETSFVKRILV